MFAWKSADELNGERDALLIEAKAICAAAESEEREMTPEEHARWDEIIRDGGLVAQVTEKRDQRIEFERRRAELEDQLQQSKERDNRRKLIGGPVKSNEAFSQEDAWRDVRLLNSRSRNFSDDRLAYLSGCWLQAVSGRECSRQGLTEMKRLGWSEYAAQVEGTGAKGGYLVPQPLVAEIIRNRDEVGVATSLARVMSMSSETIGMPEETGVPTVYYPGEAGEITASDATIKQHQLTVKKRAVLVKVSPELVRDAVISAAEYIVDTMGYALALAMDNELLNGAGTSAHGGEVGLIASVLAGQTKTADVGEDTLAELDLQEWTDTIGLVPGKYLARPRWVMSREVWHGACLPILAAAGGNTIATLQAGQQGQQFLGYPVTLTDQMPKAAASTIVALFGDFSRAVTIGDRGDMELSSTSEAYFSTDELGFKLTHRYDVLVNNPGAYAALKTAA